LVFHIVQQAKSGDVLQEDRRAETCPVGIANGKDASRKRVSFFADLHHDGLSKPSGAYSALCCRHIAARVGRRSDFGRLPYGRAIFSPFSGKQHAHKAGARATGLANFHVLLLIDHQHRIGKESIVAWLVRLGTD